MVYFDKKYGWEKIKDIGLHTIGSVWTKDGKYYYFDDLGNNQLVKNTVFEINDKNVVNELLSNSNKISIDRIRDIINQSYIISLLEIITIIISMIKYLIVCEKEYNTS